MATVVVTAVALVPAACASGDDAGRAHDHDHAHVDATSFGQPDRPVAGPQGAVPQFVVECGYSHAAMDDPIVYPGQPGASHLHVFFGNREVDAHSTTESLLTGTTTCDQSEDLAAYWAPALLDDGELVEPVKTIAYYRPGLGVDPSTVQAYPPGFQVVAGNAAATSAQPVSIVAWSCGVGITREATPPECPEQRHLRLIVTFPDCWDGVRLDSPDHHAHVAYSSGGACPADWPVPVPQLQLSIEYPVTGPTDGLMLASGGLLSGHADFMNGWEQPELERQVALCLHREVVCGVVSGRVSG